MEYLEMVEKDRVKRLQYCYDRALDATAELIDVHEQETGFPLGFGKGVVRSLSLSHFFGSVRFRGTKTDF